MSGTGAGHPGVLGNILASPNGDAKRGRILAPWGRAWSSFFQWNIVTNWIDRAYCNLSVEDQEWGRNSTN